MAENGSRWQDVVRKEHATTIIAVSFYFSSSMGLHESRQLHLSQIK